MLKKIGKYLFIVLILAFSLSGFSETEEKAEDQTGKVYATLSDNDISVGDTIAYNIVIENVDDSGAIGEPRLPDLQGFQIRNRQSGTEARSEFINGKFTFVKKQIYTYYLKPTVTGSFKLNPAEIVIGNKTYRTQSLKIQVENGSAGGQRPRNEEIDEQDMGGADPFEEADKIFDQLLKRSLPNAQTDPKINMDEAFFVRVEVDKDKVFAGEQVTATWYLYTRNNLTNFEPVKYPDLKGFWKEDIEISTRLNFENVVINGIPYRKALLVSYALFPIKEGTATIDSYKLKATAMVANPFGVFGKPYTFTKVNPPVKISVLPIPKDNQPSDFGNAVGNFNMTGTVDKTTIPVNEPFTFKLRFDGRGNAKQIELPALNLSDKFEQYDTKQDSKFFKDGTSYKEFEILLIPRITGELEIPALSVSFFNPQTKQFERKTTQSIKLNVVQGKNLGSGSSESFVGGDVKTGAKVGLPGPVTEIGTMNLSHSMLLKIWMFISVIVLVFVGFVFVKELRITGHADIFAKEMSRRFANIQKLMTTNLREASVQSLNLIDYVLSEVTQDRESHAIQELLRKISPLYKNELNDEFRRALKYFETVAFAPQELVKDLMNESKFKEEFKVVKKALLNTVQIYSKNG